MTDLKHQNNSQRKQAHFFSSILSSIKDGISISDNEMNILYVNPVMEEWYSHNLPLIGKKCYTAYHGRTKPCKVCPVIKTYKTKKPAYELVPKTGRGEKVIGYYDLYSFPFVDMETGKMIGVIEYVRDVTDKKKAEATLDKTERHYKALAETARDMIFVIGNNYSV